MITYSDDFNRADAGDLGANWGGNPTLYSIVSSRASPESASAYQAVWAAPCTTDDNFSQVTLATVGVSSSVGVVCRWGTTGVAENGYVWRATSAASALFAVVNGVYTKIGTDYNVNTHFAGTVFQISAIGSTITGYVNGVARMTVTDTTHATGKYVGLRAGSACTLDNWSGGDGGGYITSTVGTALWPRDLNYQLNRLAKTLVNDRPTLAADAAANKWAGTTKELPLQGALNFKCGILWTKDYFAIRRACNQIAGTINEDPAYALSTIATPATLVVGPQATATREEIIEWLEDNGAPLESEALQELTTDELLALVEDLTNEERP